MNQDLSTVGQIIGATITGVLALSYPLMKLVRMWSQDKNATSKDNAESQLYNTLNNQIKILSEGLDTALAEKTKLAGEVASTKLRLLKADQTKQMLEYAHQSLRRRDDDIAVKETHLNECSAKAEALSRVINELKSIVILVQENGGLNRHCPACNVRLYPSATLEALDFTRDTVIIDSKDIK